MNVPSWLPPAARVVLSVLALAIGLSGWADGWGMALVPIASGIIVAELVGHYGVTSEQAAQFTAQLEAFLADPAVKAAVMDALTAAKARFGPPPPPPASP